MLEFPTEGKTMAQHARYDGYHLTMTLQHGIGMERFDANKDNFLERLVQHRNMPRSLKMLLAELFNRGAIVNCSITFGTRMDLQLPNKSPKGHHLFSSKALELFQKRFAEITGVQVMATWSDNTPLPRRSGSKQDYSSAVAAFADIIDAVASGLVIGAAIKTLFGGGSN